MKMRVSAIVPAYNAERFLARAVESLIQTDYPNLEIIIIDDGSTDHTLTVACGLQQTYPTVVLVLQHSDRSNHGVSASRNLGIENSTGEIICFLDADDYVYAHRFETSALMLESDQTIDGVYELTEMQFESDDDRVLWGFEGNLFGLKTEVLPDQLLETLLNGSVWATSAIVVRRTLLNETGCFPVAQSIAEDCSLWFRMAAVGRIVPGEMSKSVSVYYRHSGNTFQPEMNHKPEMMATIIDVYHWARKKNTSRRVLDSFRSRITYMLLQELLESRQSAAMPGLLQLVVVNRCYSVLFQKTVLRNIFACLFGKLMLLFHKPL